MAKEPDEIHQPDEQTDTASPPESAANDKSIVLARDILPEVLPVIPLYDRPLFPKMMGPIFIQDKKLIKAILEDLDENTPKYLGLIMARGSHEHSELPVKPEDLYEVGTAGRIVQVSPIQQGAPLQILVQVLQRFDVEEMVETKPIFKARVRYWYEGADIQDDEELKAYSLAVIEAIKELVKLNPLYKEGLSMLLERINIHEPGSLADLAAALTTSTGEELQKILEIRPIRQRIEQVLILMKRELEISKLKVDISKRIEERLSKQQREFFLKQQLKEIKKELGLAKDDTETELEKFKKRLKTLNPSDEGRDRIEEEMEKLKLLEPSSAEFNVTRAYLDWLTILPWGVYTKDNYDINKAAKILDREHYGLADVKSRILELISVGIIKGDLAGSIILLVGPPGVGKTSIGQSIAKSLNRKFYRFSLGGMRDEAEIKGHRRTYIGALPGKFLQAMKTCKTANPVIMLDEVDKIGASFQGDPASALLEVLDLEQNRDFLDHYLDVRFDLSKVLFICTANQLETIPAPLLDRMEHIKLAGYILEEKIEIAKRHLIPKQLAMHGLKKSQVRFSKEVLKEIIDGYAREAGVRGLENRIKKILRQSARKIVEKEDSKVSIRKADLQELLGRRVFKEEKLHKKPRKGVVMGLAYTTLGGATLYIEATPVPAQSPGFKQTGQLGKVMVESSEIAYTYVRSLLKSNKTVVDFFAQNLIHLHVPAGATPKDGPSAGITMACALYSLATGKTVIPALAMTGELTLTGKVMPIGGVKEKLIAAKRAHVKTVILPSENQADFEDLELHIREGIDVNYVSEFTDLIPICFPNTKTRGT